MVQNDDLSEETGSIFCWIILGVRSDESSSDIFDWQIFNIESNIITGLSFFQNFVMHFNGFAFCGNTEWGEGENHTWFKDTGFNSSNWNSSNTTDLVNVL